MLTGKSTDHGTFKKGIITYLIEIKFLTCNQTFQRSRVVFHD